MNLRSLGKTHRRSKYLWKSPLPTPRTFSRPLPQYPLDSSPKKSQTLSAAKDLQLFGPQRKLQILRCAQNDRRGLGFLGSSKDSGFGERDYPLINCFVYPAAVSFSNASQTSGGISCGT